MSKWIKRIFLFIATLVTGLSSFGLSSWYFSKTQEIDKKIDNSNNNDGYKMDDIEENYRFGKADEEKRYTMYFFPSAAYMFLYGRYLEDNPLYYGPHYLPEEEFGYKEVLINESGNVLTDKDGNALFKLSENTGKYQNDVNINSDTSYDGSYKLFINKHFRINDETELDGKAGSGSIYEHSQKSGRTWGSPTDTLTFDPNNKNRVEQYNGKDLFSLDRFGCWGDSYYYGYSGDENGANVTFKNDEKANSSNTGRYLPIKMTVSNAMSIDLLNKVIGDVFSSMGDTRDWYNFSFTNWTYVAKNDDGTNSYPYNWKNNNSEPGVFKPIGEAFSAKDIDRYFDVFEDLETFADEKGVIRLFPLFSNGKKYNASSYTDGGADCFKLIGDYQDNRNTSYRYFMPSSERIHDGSDNFLGTKIPNSNVRYYTYNYLKLKKSHNFSSLKIAIDWNERKPKKWAGTWHDIYSLDLNYIDNQLINKYGDGLYNFYLFQGNFDHKSNEISYDDFYNKIKTEAVGKNGFKTLKGKSIEFLNMPDLIKNYEHNIWKLQYYYSSPYNISPVIFAFEKIADPKIIDNVDIKGEGSNLTFESIDKLDEYIVKKSVNAHGFTRISSPIYGRKLAGESYTYSNNLNEMNPYTYIAKNVNFINAKTNYFIIAFSDVYISNVNINIENKNYSSVVVNPRKDETTNNYTYNPEDLFVNASEYIKRVTFSTGDGKDYSVLTFNNDDFKGVYDILLMYEGNNTLSLYFYRHTNLFLKIFSNDLTSYHDNFLLHDENVLTDTKLIFKKKYFLGLTMNKDDKNGMNNLEHQTLEEAITSYVETVKGAGYDLTKVRVIDHVTKTVVAKFISKNGIYELECNQKIYKNYVFYLST